MNSFIQLNTYDNIVIALRNLKAGENINVNRVNITLLADIGFGHKVAVATIPGGQKVIKYGLPIGISTTDILPGQHVHTHNLVTAYDHQ